MDTNSEAGRPLHSEPHLRRRARIVHFTAVLGLWLGAACTGSALSYTDLGDLTWGSSSRTCRVPPPARWYWGSATQALERTSSAESRLAINPARNVCQPKTYGFRTTKNYIQKMSRCMADPHLSKGMHTFRVTN